MSSGPRVAIVGGGISGLAAAHYLRKAGIASTVFEARPQLGGLLRTEYIDGCIIETGAESWLAAKPAARELSNELGVALTGSNDSARGTLIWKRGRALPFPNGMQLVAPTRLGPILRSPLLGAGTKLRVALDWLRTRPGTGEQSVADLVRDHFGQEAVDYLADPLLSGIYGGSPATLSARSVIPKLLEHERRTGSLTRGLRNPSLTGALFETVQAGLGCLVEALRPKSVVHGRVEAIEPGRVRSGGDWLPFEKVLLACEPHEAARLAPQPVRELLQPIRSSSAHIAVFGFPKMLLRGFGMLIPRREGGNLMACTFMDNKFPHRVAPGLTHIRAFFREPPQDPLADLRTALPHVPEPVFLRQYHWPLSLPQYSPGHSERIEAVRNALQAFPWLGLIGNAFIGVGIPDCIRLARDAAQSLAACLQ